jgi:RNA polymerase sigma-70 factor (ECF subfamily)
VSDRTGELKEGEGLATLYRRHALWLTRRLCRRFGEDGEDIAQDAWRKLAGAYATGREIRHPRALLMTVAGRLASDRAARRSRREGLETAAAASVPSAEASGQEAALMMEQLILGLPDDLRSVFVMSRFGGLTNAQIGVRLGLSPKTVEWRMTRALAHVTAQLRR